MRSRRPRRAGRLRDLKGMSAKTEERLLEGLKSLRARPPRRMRLGTAQTSSSASAGSLVNAKGVDSVTAAGSTAAAARPSPTSTSWSKPTTRAAVIDKLHDSPMDRTGRWTSAAGLAAARRGRRCS